MFILFACTYIVFAVISLRAVKLVFYDAGQKMVR